MHAIVISGPPASGKTFLAARLSEDLQVPIIARDAIKESLFDSLGHSDREWSQKLGAASYDVLFSLTETQFVSHVPCFLLEANFTDRAATKLQSMANQHTAHLIQIFCHASNEVLWQRFQQRALSGQRHPGHVDAENLEEAKTRFFGTRPKPLDLRGQLIEVDTTDLSKLDYPSIIGAIRLNSQTV